MKKPKILSPRFVETVREPDPYGDGHGRAWPNVERTSRRKWAYYPALVTAYQDQRRVTHIGLGAYPLVSLAEAQGAGAGKPGETF